MDKKYHALAKSITVAEKLRRLKYCYKISLHINQLLKKFKKEKKNAQ